MFAGWRNPEPLSFALVWEGGQSMEAKETPVVEIGSPVPDFQLPAHMGKTVDVRAYREHSKLVLFFVREFN
jgi:hypothetical protein